MTTYHWTHGLHHDGSEVYVSNPTPKFHETVTVSLRTPSDSPIQSIFLRTAPDGEKHLEPMTKSEDNGHFAVWTAQLKMTMPTMTYRFKLITTEGAYYLNQRGVSRAEHPDYWDFTLLADFISPSWLEDAIFYQIFPDRFHNGDPALNIEAGAWSVGEHQTQLLSWDTLPLPWAETGNLDFRGGDLIGIQQKIDYLKTLGINALYLNPIFVSQSNHRYNVDDFYTVDKHLGGNDALVNLSDALHQEDMRIVLDLTPNHSANTHHWFIDAQVDENALSAEYYTFYERPNDYEMWLGVPILPKLNYASDTLRDAMYRNDDAVMHFWLNAPYNIDGWRLDVANMTARQGAIQLSHEVWREVRQHVKSRHPESYVFGEDFQDGTPYLQGDELDATMNYQGFNLPTWRWLSGYDLGSAEKADTIPIPTEAYEEQRLSFRAVIPWAIACQQFNQLGSHDTRRILNIVNHDKDLMKLGVAMLMTYVGVPCIYYGDEIGLAGENDPDNRRTMPWDESQWDIDLLDWHKRLIHLRKTAPALMRGGYQTLYAQGDVLAYLRQSKEQTLVIIGHRGQNTLAEFNLPVRHGGLADGTQLVNLLNDSQFVTVQEGHINIQNLPHGGVYIFEVQ